MAGNLAAVATISLLAIPSSCAHAQSAAVNTSRSLPFIRSFWGGNMVLRRGKINVIWRWPDPGDKIRVQIADESATGVAAADRRW